MTIHQLPTLAPAALLAMPGKGRSTIKYHKNQSSSPKAIPPTQSSMSGAEN